MQHHVSVSKNKIVSPCTLGHISEQLAFDEDLNTTLQTVTARLQQLLQRGLQYPLQKYKASDSACLVLYESHRNAELN